MRVNTRDRAWDPRTRGATLRPGAVRSPPRLRTLSVSPWPALGARSTPSAQAGPSRQPRTASRSCSGLLAAGAAQGGRRGGNRGLRRAAARRRSEGRVAPARRAASRRQAGRRVVGDATATCGLGFPVPGLLMVVVLGLPGPLARRRHGPGCAGDRTLADVGTLVKGQDPRTEQGQVHRQDQGRNQGRGHPRSRTRSTGATSAITLMILVGGRIATTREPSTKNIPLLDALLLDGVRQRNCGSSRCPPRANPRRGSAR